MHSTVWVKYMPVPHAPINPFVAQVPHGSGAYASVCAPVCHDCFTRSAELLGPSLNYYRNVRFALFMAALILIVILMPLTVQN